MAAIENNLSDPEHENWRITLEKYNDILCEKADRKTKKTATRELQDLDKWFQTELPVLIHDREEKYMTSEELVKLMKWKLARGKFRPRLVELAGSNDDADVREKTKMAYKKATAGKIKAAIECLTPLKGIGPATASAILTASCPEQAAFMADEPTKAILGAGGLKYNLQEYLTYMQTITECTNKLKQQDAGYGWTPHKVELALWTSCVASTLGVELAANKRKTTQQSQQKAKKMKT